MGQESNLTRVMKPLINFVSKCCSLIQIVMTQHIVVTALSVCAGLFHGDTVKCVVLSNYFIIQRFITVVR